MRLSVLDIREVRKFKSLVQREEPIRGRSGACLRLSGAVLSTVQRGPSPLIQLIHGTLQLIHGTRGPILRAFSSASGTLIGGKSVGRAECHHLDYKQSSGLVGGRLPDELAIGKWFIVARICASWAYSLGAPDRSKHRPKMMGKCACKVASGTMGTRTPFSKAGISLNSIWRPIFKNPQKRGPIPKKPNETGNFRGDHQPKRAVPKRTKKTAQK